MLSIDAVSIIQAGRVRAGDAANYIDLSTAGIWLTGSSRYKRRIRAAIAGLGKAVAAPTDAYLGNYMGYAFNIGDLVYFVETIPFRWDELTNISANLIWGIDEVYATNSGEVQWQVGWSSTPKNGLEALDSPTHSGTLVTGDINIGTVAKGLFDTEFSTEILYGSLAAHDLMGFNLSRIALVGGNNPIADPIALELELVFTFDNFGEGA